MMKKIYHLLFSTDKKYWRKLRGELKNAGSVLDLGCGGNSPLRHIKYGNYSVGVDAQEETSKIHDRYIRADVLDIDKIFPKKSFDAVIALDLIEHLEKERGLALLHKMETIARKKIIIFTPNGFVEQNNSDEFQKHRSGWSLGELKNAGFKCVGMSGLKSIKRDRGAVIQKPMLFWKIIKDLSQPFIYRLPSLAFHLFCVKDI
ncbi:class I SAM-dependent methyltransferase [Patescibacteria group bacterium]|nr:class I SAM-dependent methyltransferase [Patescibacteria group bacterium]